MSELIGILGDSGKGKTTSFRNLDPEETAIINVSGKPLPFKGWKGNYEKGIKSGGNYAVTNKAKKIEMILKYIHKEREDIKIVVIDDMQYIQAFEFFKRRDEKNYQKFNDIGGHLFDVLNTARNLREDLRVVTTFHPDESGEGLNKKKVFKTLGESFCPDKTPLIAGNSLEPKGLDNQQQSLKFRNVQRLFRKEVQFFRIGNGEQ